MPRGRIPSEETITFHLIYLRNSVRELHPLLQALLRWSRCRFRLIGNGTSAAENAFLREYAAREPRISLRFVGEDTEPIQHADMLQLIVNECDEEYIAFLDSDIVVDGPFMPELLAGLADADAVFSGSPLSFTRQDLAVAECAGMLAGRHAWDMRGQIRGGTYCAIIRRSVLVRGLAECPTAFRPAVWCHLPKAIRRSLQRSRQVYLYYDTARVLFSLMLARGTVFAWAEPTHLHHLSGYSRIVLEGNAVQERKVRLKANAKARPQLLRRIIGMRRLLHNPKFCRVWLKLRYAMVQQRIESPGAVRLPTTSAG